MSKDLFWGLLLFLTLAQWIIYAKVREWWRSRHPEPRQGKPVDRVLYHLLSDWETPWDAGTSWEKVGRGYIVSLQRQGLDELLDERDVSDHKPAYTLGYCVREQEDTKELEALRARLKRREEALQRKQEEVDGLREKLAQRHAAAPTPQRSPSPSDPMQEVWEEWGRSEAGIEEIMREKGWVRVAATSTVEPVHVAEEPEAVYSLLTGDERKETMAALKNEGKSYTEIAQLFGVSVGCVKSTVSQYRKNKVVELHFGEGLEGVCGGV